VITTNILFLNDIEPPCRSTARLTVAPYLRRETSA
jgi:hypothetical protein